MTSMLLSELAAAMPGSERFGNDVAVTDVVYDSRSVTPGALFVALRGARSDGHDYIPEVMAHGAAALVVNADRRDAYTGGVPVIVLPDTRAALPALAANFYRFPSRSLYVVGITGTNGKTTTTHMVESIFRTMGERTAMIGTLGAFIDGLHVPQDRTTPESADLQRLFAQMANLGVKRVAMEVSSEGVLAGRTSQTAFDVAAFTNLTQDHLNTHGTMENYFQQKLRLFTEYPDAFPDKPFAGVVNIDDPYGVRIVESLQRAGRRALTFSLRDPKATLFAEIAEARPDGTDFTLTYRPSTGVPVVLPLSLRMGGLFNVSNALAAMGVAFHAGVPAEAIKSGLEALTGVPGRFERIETGNRGFQVLVDYAHSPDGLHNVLESARALKPRRLVCIFGCGGDRDPLKRPQMGKISVDLADLTIITSDNPRSEEPEAIIAQILAGIPDGRENENVVVEADRYEAIRKTLCDIALPGDLIVVAGKGHETGQQFKDRKIPFDDRQVCREALATCS